MNQYFNNSAVGIYKDLSFFSKKRISEVKKNLNILPHDAFLEFCTVYKKFINQTDLRNDYLKFCEVYEFFENTIILPKTLHSKHINVYEELSSLEECTSDELDKDNSILPSLKDNNKTLQHNMNLSSMKTIYKVFQDT